MTLAAKEDQIISYFLNGVNVIEDQLCAIPQHVPSSRGPPRTQCQVQTLEARDVCELLCDYRELNSTRRACRTVETPPKPSTVQQALQKLLVVCVQPYL